MRYDTDSSFVLEGNITGMDTGRVVLQYGNKNGAYVVDTTLVKNGRFRFKGTVDRIAYALLVGNLNTRLVEDPNNTSFFIEPGKLNIAFQYGDAAHARYSGAKTQAEKISWDSAESSLYKRLHASDGEEWKAVRGQIRDMDIAYICRHPDSYLSAMLLGKYANSLSLDSVNLLYQRLSDNIKSCNLGVGILEIVNRKIKIADTDQRIEVGAAPAPFHAITMDNLPITPDSLKGKVVLLDFWSSICGPCIQSFPDVIEFYRKYHPAGLEVIAISTDFKEEHWKAMIKKLHIGHLTHVFRHPGTVRDKDGTEHRYENFTENYEIAMIPYTILIGKTGLVVEKYSGFSKEHMDFLDKQIAAELAK